MIATFLKIAAGLSAVSLWLSLNACSPSVSSKASSFEASAEGEVLAVSTTEEALAYASKNGYFDPNQVLGHFPNAKFALLLHEVMWTGQRVVEGGRDILSPEEVKELLDRSAKGQAVPVLLGENSNATIGYNAFTGISDANGVVKQFTPLYNSVLDLYAPGRLDLAEWSRAIGAAAFNWKLNGATDGSHKSSYDFKEAKLVTLSESLPGFSFPEQKALEITLVRRDIGDINKNWFKAYFAHGRAIGFDVRAAELPQQQNVATTFAFGSRVKSFVSPAGL